MSVRHLLAAAAAARLGFLGLATPVATEVLAQPTAGNVYWTAGRTWAFSAALLGLAGAIVGLRAMARSAGGVGAGRRGAVVALTAGVAAAVIGGLVVAAAEGGPGTGYGIVGGYLAVAIGLVAVVIGGLTLARSRAASPGR